MHMATNSNTSLCNKQSRLTQTAHWVKTQPAVRCRLAEAEGLVGAKQAAYKHMVQQHVEYHTYCTHMTAAQPCMPETD